MHKIAAALSAVVRGLDRLFTLLTTATFIAIVAVVLLQVVARYALPRSPAWTEEVSRYLFIYLVVLPTGLVVARNRHVRLELFHHRLTPRWAAAYHLICHSLIAAFSLIALPYAWQYAMIGRLQTSPAVGVPMIWIFMSTVLFFALLSLYSLAGGLRALIALLGNGEAAWK